MSVIKLLLPPLEAILCNVVNMQNGHLLFSVQFELIAEVFFSCLSVDNVSYHFSAFSCSSFNSTPPHPSCLTCAVTDCVVTNPAHPTCPGTNPSLLFPCILCTYVQDKAKLDAERVKLERLAHLLAEQKTQLDTCPEALKEQLQLQLCRVSTHTQPSSASSS